ncbi:hypothetical protein SMACR_03845 [Sordaria macrospora]|uniref:WGS project CABT00000000 data, contig 2.16 n=2 Tax=Sordaria macrospora TaxID=5147 RepID=F7W040_SORMK|nr:uncharacterized protein SMAC_03845 [Sordaria macrospora k-hell]KAA8636612.1 hypothetical protein SMACR_03845 [Sordaria macrospora]WPJ66504.1 hypothetical protein SMAC4_03845 [Sordaria macrospora]CCC11139.1 unnamed protein product [Sordaria macrospora k-hell]
MNEMEIDGSSSQDAYAPAETTSKPTEPAPSEVRRWVDSFWPFFTLDEDNGSSSHHDSPTESSSKPSDAVVSELGSPRTSSSSAPSGDPTQQAPPPPLIYPGEPGSPDVQEQKSASLVSADQLLITGFLHNLLHPEVFLPPSEGQDQDPSALALFAARKAYNGVYLECLAVLYKAQNQNQEALFISANESKTDPAIESGSIAREEESTNTTSGTSTSSNNERDALSTPLPHLQLPSSDEQEGHSKLVQEKKSKDELWQGLYDQRDKIEQDYEQVKADIYKKFEEKNDARMRYRSKNTRWKELREELDEMTRRIISRRAGEKRWSEEEEGKHEDKGSEEDKSKDKHEGEDEKAARYRRTHIMETSRIFDDEYMALYEGERNQRGKHAAWLSSIERRRAKALREAKWAYDEILKLYKTVDERNALWMLRSMGL